MAAPAPVVKEQDHKISCHQNRISFKGKKVFISFESSSLGDTISWVPYCEEFRKKHNCEVVVSTFKNFLFEKTYPNLKFVKPRITKDNFPITFEYIQKSRLY